MKRPHVAHGGVVEWLDLPKNQLLQEEVGVHTEDAEEACEASCDMTKSAVDLLETEAIVSSTWARRGGRGARPSPPLVTMQPSHV